MAKPFPLLVLGLFVGVCCAGVAEDARVAGPVSDAIEIQRVEIQLGEGDLLAGIPGEGPLALAEIRDWLADPKNHRELIPLLPMGLDEGSADIRLPKDNPLTRAKIELGRQLYFDPRMSLDGTVSCASCHAPEHGFAFPSRVGIGVGGQEGTRNSPTVGNRILSGNQFWDGRAESLESQAVGPMTNPIEMGFTHAGVIGFCKQVEGYRLQFASVFEGDVTIENVGRAIASFERAIVSGPSPWDHHRRLKKFEEAFQPDELDEELAAELAELRQAAAKAPLSDSAARGAELFFSDRTGCTQCHAGANYSDEQYHNLGVGMERLDGLSANEAIPDDLARAIDWGGFTVTGRQEDRGAFKTPALRNIAQSAPYMHDGSQETLAEVVAFYVEGGHANPYLSPRLEPLDLSDAEQADLVAFLESLSGDWPVVETDRLPADTQNASKATVSR